jgi:localization factor PodJL
MSQWIDTAVERAAEADLAARPRPRRGDDPVGAGAARFHDRLDDIAARLDRLVQRTQAPSTAHDRRHDDLDPAARDLESRLAAMARDLPRTEPAPDLAEAIGRVDQRLDQLMADKRAIDTHREPARPPAPVAGPSFSLDDAIAEIAARQHALDADADGPAPAPAVNLSGIEHLLHSITGEIETLKRPCAVEDSVAALRRELAEVGRTVTQAMPHAASLDAMQSELRSLSERIEHGRPRGDDDPALSAIERGLNEVRDALTVRATTPSHAGFDDEGAAPARNGPDAETLDHLETAIAELRNVSARVASGDAVAALASDVRMIGAKLDRVAPAAAPDHEGLDHLVRGIDALAVALEGRPASSEPAGGAQIETHLKRLTDKLETVETAAERRGFEQLEGQIAQLTQKLDAADARLGNLGTIELAIADLVERLHDTRASALDAAEQAARSAVREMAGTSSASGPEVAGLKHELADFRATQADIDRRTQDMLESLQGTLERLVDRIGAIETGMQTGGSATESGSLPAAVPTSPLMAPPGRPMAPFVERRAINQALPGDRPLEPGTGAPRIATPAERIAASEAMLPPKKTAPEPAGKANFIAAARRAAQAAAADASSEGTRSPEAGGHSSLLGTVGAAIAKRRRPLLIGIGVVLLALGTLQLVTHFLGSGEPRSAPSETTGTRGATPPAAPQSSGPVAPTEIVPPPAAGPERRSENIPADPAANPLAPAGATLPATGSGTLDGMAPIVPPFPTMPGVTSVKPGDGTGSTGRAPATAAVAPAAPVPPDAASGAADKLPAATVGPGLRSAALAGNPAAEYELAVRYAEGRGVPPSIEQAVHWFERAANHGLAPAQYRLGSLYEKGQGVKKDLEGARRLYTAAANKGNGKAMHNLAVLYAEGLSGEPDYRNASQWFRKAADYGIADSQYNLGILYARGIGVEQNLAESYKWFALAAQQGDKDSAKKRDDVAARLDAQSLVAARLAVQTWTADPQPEEAVEVKAPPGGWEKPAAAPHPAKVKPAVGAPRKLTPA